MDGLEPTEEISRLAAVATGRASEALGVLLNEEIRIKSLAVYYLSSPERLLTRLRLPRRLVTVTQSINGYEKGKISLAIARESAPNLASLLVGRHGLPNRRLGGFELDSLKEAANIITGSYLALLGRLYARGLEEVPLIVADGCGSVRAAAQVVYPQAQLQPCLRHWLQNLESLLHQRNWLHRRRLRRDFWWIYEAENVEQAERWALHFLRRWARSEPAFVQQFWQGFEASITFLKLGLRTWSYRLKTTNLAEGFFRNLRRFLGRFPGFVSPQHSERALGLYLLGADHA